jgi:ATP-binding cassette, subfamily B, bacterial PglK
MLKRLWQHLTKRRKAQYFLILILMIITALSEVVTIGAIVPFIAILTAPEQIYQHHLMEPTILYLDLTSPKELILPLTFVFILSVILAGAIRLVLLYSTIRLSYATGADLSINMYQRTLYQDYSVHVTRNTSEVISGIIRKTDIVIGSVITPTLTLCSSIFIMTGIIITLFFINTLVAVTALVGFGMLYGAVVIFTRKQLKENSKCIADKSTQMVKSLQEGLGGIRDVLIDGNQQFYCKIYRSADLPFRRASGDNAFIGSCPKYVAETIGMTLIAGLAYIMTRQENSLNFIAIPVLGAMALGAQRILPAIQQAYQAFSNLKSAKSSFEDVLLLLDQPLPDYAGKPFPIPLPFEKGIELKNLSFRYSKDVPWVLKNADLKLIKGTRIGFMGVTGSGKSTMLDIIMGLLSPTEGKLIIDDQPINDKNRRSWQAHISHVPQNIYLSDSTIENNIAFGIPKEQINHQLVKKAAQQAQIAELIEDWKDGYQTFVGERGIRLSGGQRQRIGIARALYKKANVLIFDEATNALDNETEQAVMEAIEGLGSEITILIIAHRLTTLKSCDQIVKLDKNGIIKYDDVS